MTHQTIVVLDFGSQYTQLIARRLRELGVYSEVVPWHEPAGRDPGPRSPPASFCRAGRAACGRPGRRASIPPCSTLGVPVLGICYGMQLMTDLLGGRSSPAPQPRVRAGDGDIPPSPAGALFEGLPGALEVWASHGDFVAAAPPGFRVVGDQRQRAGRGHGRSRRGGCSALLFHPEVAHTTHGRRDAPALRLRRLRLHGATGTSASYADEAVARIREQVGGGRVICALSGGVDSTVAALLIHRAIGDRLTCVFVDNGVLRLDEAAQVQRRLAEKYQLPVVSVDASERFLTALAGVTDPEQKRKIIGRLFIDVFEEEAARLGGFDFLAQGTLYPDVIESVSVVGPSAAIKSHHNVGGLPETMRLTLVEPLRAAVQGRGAACSAGRSASTRSSSRGSRFPGRASPCASSAR